MTKVPSVGYDGRSPFEILARDMQNMGYIYDLEQKMNSIDFNVLKNYKKADSFPEEHRSALHRWASIGHVKFGFNVRRRCETAKLTEIGRRWIEREEIKRSPTRRFFHAWINNLF